MTLNRRHPGLLALLLLAALLPTAFSGDSIIQHVHDGTNVDVGFDALEPGAHDLTLTLQANGSATTIYYSWVNDPNGTIVWTNDNNTSAFEHHWTANGVHGYDVTTPSFGGYTNDPADPWMMYGVFQVKVSHLDMDLDDLSGDPPPWPGQPDPKDEAEADTGVSMPITYNAPELPETFPIGDTTGRALSVNIISGQGGTLVFEGTSSQLQVYRANGNVWEKVIAGLPVTGGSYSAGFRVHTSSQFTGPVMLKARLQHATSALDAADEVKVVYDQSPPGSPNAYLNLAADSDNDNLDVALRPPNYTQDEEDEEENPGMKMYLGEDWARVELNLTDFTTGTLTLKRTDVPGMFFETADSGFNPLTGETLFCDTVSGSSVSLVFYVRPTTYPYPGSVTLTATFDDGAGLQLQDVLLINAVTTIVDLDIFNGQGATSQVAEKDEEEIGAFTVGNENDTDGDGIPDNQDSIVRGASFTLSAALAAGSAFVPSPAAATPNPWTGKVGTYYQIAAIKKAGEIAISEVVQIESYDGTNNRLILRTGTTTQKAYAAGDSVFLQGMDGLGSPRDEVDLMKLIIRKPKPALETDSVTLQFSSQTLAIGSAVALWGSALKVTQIPLTNGAAQFTVSSLPKEVWVELRYGSPVVKDITITLTKGADSDTVKATGIWAVQTDFRNSQVTTTLSATPAATSKQISVVNAAGLEPKDHIIIFKASSSDTRSSFTIIGKSGNELTLNKAVGPDGWTIGDEVREGLSPDVDNTKMLDGFWFAGGKLGAQHISPKTNNGTEIEFILPTAAATDWAKWKVVFDVTRQKESIGWRLTGMTWTALDIQNVVPSSWPSGEELPNDDTDANDEDSIPLNSRIYAFDFPGLNSDDATYDRYVIRYNFREFVRVRFDGNSFINYNNGLEGSRCSNKFEWRSRLDVTKNMTTMKWQRNNSQPAGEVENEIVTDHKALTQNKPPGAP